MKHLFLPAFKPMSFVTTATATWPGGDRLLLDIYLPDREVRLCFGDTAVIAAPQRALRSLLADARRLGDEGVLSHLVAHNQDRATLPRALNMF